MKPLVITGHDVLGEILRRNHARDEMDLIARQLGFTTRTNKARQTQKARLGEREFVESNLPFPDSRRPRP